MTKSEARQRIDVLGLPEAQAKAAHRTMGRATTSEAIEITAITGGNCLSSALNQARPALRSSRIQ